MQLVLDDIQRTDAGIYTVSARSPSGTSSRDIELRVNGNAGDENEPPAFLRRLNDISSKVGTRTRFLVEIKSLTQLLVSSYSNFVREAFLLTFPLGRMETRRSTNTRRGEISFCKRRTILLRRYCTIIGRRHGAMELHCEKSSRASLHVLSPQRFRYNNNSPTTTISLKYPF